MPTPSGSGRCGGEDYLYAGDTHFQKRKLTQLIKCTLWSTRLCPHPTIVKKMRTFLEVEGKMGPVPQPASSQYRPPQPDTNPNIRKDMATERRKRVAPTKRLRANTTTKPNETAVCPRQSPRPQPISNLKHKKELQKIDPHP